MKKQIIILLFFLSFIISLSAQFVQFNTANGMQHADIVAADIDHDGDLDIIVSGVTTENNLQVPKSMIYINNNGVFTPQYPENPSTFQNPVFTPDFADPTVIKAADGWYYAYGTENTWTDGHHIVPVIKSKNLIQWQYVSDAFNVRPSWKTDGGVWAPDVTYINGKYYMYYSLSTWGDANPGIGLAIADLPQGPFVDQGKLFDSNSIGVANSIDPFFIQTGSGATLKSYLFWGSFNGIYGIQLSSDLKSTTGSKFKIAGNAFEAPYIKERNGKFYFFGSIGSCCEGADSQYHIGVASANDIIGPYKNKNNTSILTNGQEGTLFLSGNSTLGWVGPGHNSKIITDNAGNDYLFYHAVDVSNPYLPGGATRRPLLLDKINWGGDGWPTINDGKPSVNAQISPVVTP